LIEDKELKIDFSEKLELIKSKLVRYGSEEILRRKGDDYMGILDIPHNLIYKAEIKKEFTDRVWSIRKAEIVVEYDKKKGGDETTGYEIYEERVKEMRKTLGYEAEDIITKT
jgi:hypothetical protein